MTAMDRQRCGRRRGGRAVASVCGLLALMQR
jgi:hypothetical protein